MEFKNHDIVYFVGPPEGEIAPIVCEMSKHKLYRRRGRIAVGISEDIRCYPDEQDDDMLWVCFDNDTVRLRQVQESWLVTEKKFYREYK